MISQSLAENSDVHWTQLPRGSSLETWWITWSPSPPPALDSCLLGSLSKITFLYKSPCHRLCFLWGIPAETLKRFTRMKTWRWVVKGLAGLSISVKGVQKDVWEALAPMTVGIIAWRVRVVRSPSSPNGFMSFWVFHEEQQKITKTFQPVELLDVWHRGEAERQTNQSIFTNIQKSHNLRRLRHYF